MTYDEACAELIANTTIEDVRKVWCELFTDIQYINHLVDKMGLPRPKWDMKKAQNAVDLLNEKGERIGQVLPAMKSIIISKRKDVKHFDLLHDETYLERAADCKERMNDWHQFAVRATKKSDYIVKLASAYCIYTVTPPIKDEMKVLVAEMFPEKA